MLNILFQSINICKFEILLTIQLLLLTRSVEKSAYVASKHGLIGLTKVVALENGASDFTSFMTYYIPK